MANATIGQERKMTQTAVHTALSIDLNETYDRKGSILFCIGSPTRQAQGLQAQENRGFEKALGYWCRMACGGGFDTLVATFKVMADASKLHEMGFSTSRHQLGHKSTWTQELLQHEVSLERDWLQLVVKLAFVLVHHRCKSLLFHWHGFPGRAAQLLSEDTGQRQAGLDYFKATASVWQAAASRTDKDVAKLCMRSSFNTPCAQHFLSCLSFHRFSLVPDEVRHCLQSTFGIGQSKMQEDAFRATRMAATRFQDNRKLSATRRWIIPVQQKVASKLYDYTEVDYKDIDRCDPAVSKKALPARFFKPLQKETKLDLKPLVGHTQKVPWTSFNAQSMSMQYSDIEALRQAHLTGSWSSLGNTWLSLACPAGQLIRKCGGQWFWSLGCMGMSALIAWPALEHKGPKGKFTYSIKLDGVSYEDLVWFPITDLADYESVHIQWAGPLQQEVAAEAKPREWPAAASRVVAEGLGKPVALVRVAASNAFFDLGPVWLRMLASHYLIEVPTGLDLCGLLTKLVKHFLGNISDKELLRILGRRVKVPDEESIQVDDEVLEQAVEASDMQTFEDAERSEKYNTAAMKEFTKSYKALHKKVRTSQAPKGTGSAASSSAGSKKASKAQTLRTLPVFDKFDALSQEDAALFMPPLIGFGKDVRNQRWWARDEPFSISRSFAKYGETVAFALVCSEAHSWHGIECTHEWVTRLAAAADLD